MDVVSMKPVSSMHAQFLQSLQPYGLQTPRPLCPWDSPGKDTEVGCHALLQGIFPTQELNPSLLHLPHCTWILYPLSHLGSPISAISSVQFSHSVMSDSLLLHEPQHARPPYPPCQASLPPSLHPNPCPLLPSLRYGPHPYGSGEQCEEGRKKGVPHYL